METMITISYDRGSHDLVKYGMIITRKMVEDNLKVREKKVNGHIHALNNAK